MKTWDLVIIGAGASGLFCALTAGSLGKRVLVLDHANKAGKKILMSGGGKCNFTNVSVSYKNYVGQNPSFVRSALARFGVEDFMAYIHKHKIAFCERDGGELFCEHSARDILDMLLTECADNGVQIRLNTRIDAIKKDDNFVLDIFDKKHHQADTITAHSLVVATGGLSIPTMGATGFGYEIARQFGHRIVPTAPSLVPLTFSDNIKDLAVSLAGVSCDVVAFNDKIQFARPMLFTHRGLSGPAILQLSNYWKLSEPIFVNLLPNVQADEWLLDQKRNQPKKHLRTILAPFFAKNLLNTLQDTLWSKLKDKNLADIKDEELRQLGKTLNAWRLLPSGTEGYRVAEVTKGGVSVDEISSKTFESKLCDNLYFIGEVLDVTGQLGGFNFQWAWASGYACAWACVKKTRA